MLTFLIIKKDIILKLIWNINFWIVKIWTYFQLYSLLFFLITTLDFVYYLYIKTDFIKDDQVCRFKKSLKKLNFPIDIRKELKIDQNNLLKLGLTLFAS